MFAGGAAPAPRDPPVTAEPRAAVWPGRVAAAAVLAAVAAVAVGSAQCYPIGPNDGSRLATAECLVDRHTLAIDDATYQAICDKLLINGHFYSDKPPILSFLLAGEYQLLQWAFGLRVQSHYTWVTYWLTLGSSGLAYVAAVWCVYRTAGVLGLPLLGRLAVAASFGLATVALPYTRHVNAHIIGLGLAAAVFWQLAELGRTGGGGRPVVRLLTVGALGGLAYAVEAPTGGLMLAGAALVAAWRRPTWGAAACAAVWVSLGAFPWIALHHAVTYAYAGTFGPPSSHPEFFNYPDSEFNASNMTGRWNHADADAFLAYAFLLLFGSRGFVLANPTLWLAGPAAAAEAAAGRAADWRPEALFGLLWAAGVWLVYAALSTNFGGVCCTIRWFVPLLAPAYFVLAARLRERPALWPDFLLVSAWGCVLAWFAWMGGPWYERPPQLNGAADPVFWGAQAGLALSWGGLWAWRRRARRAAARSAAAQQAAEVRDDSDGRAERQAGGVGGVGDRAEQAGEAQHEPDQQDDDRARPDP